MGTRSVARYIAALVATGVLLAACGTNETPSGRTPTATALPASASPAPASPAPASAVVPSPSATAVPSPPATPSNPAAGWRPVADQPALQGVKLTAIARGKDTFVAAGIAGDRAFFLDSPDGLTWHRGPDLDTETSVVSLAAGPRSFIAVGRVSDHPASWTSDDGRSWTMRIDPFPMPRLRSDLATVTGVIANGDGWIVVGREDPDCHTDCGLAPVRALVWTGVRTANGGLQWARVKDQPALVGGGMVSIARADTGFVAAGVDARHAAVWTSADGMTWARVPDVPAFHALPDTPADASNAAAVMDHVVAGHGVVVGFGSEFAVGSGGAPGAAAWWSAEGHAWSAVPVPDWTPDYVYSLTLTTDGFLATGNIWDGGSWRRLVWRSTDGQSWQTVPAGSMPDAFDPVAVASTPSVEVAVGAAEARGPAWWRPVP